MSAWALGSTADSHAPMRTLEEVRDDLRGQHRRLMPIENAIAIVRHIEAIEAEIAIRNKQEKSHA